MGFEYINDEQKIRISLSNRAYYTMIDDMAVFDIRQPATFINAIIKNFRENSMSSMTNYLENWREIEYQKYTDIPINPETKDLIIDKLYIQEEKRISNILKEYMKGGENSKLYRINNENIDYLKYYCEDDEFYKQRPGLFIKCLMEEYSEHPFIERERIFRKDVYEMIEYACANQKTMQVRMNLFGKKETIVIYPYKITSDPMNYQSYLACYSRKQKESAKDKIDASFSMARIPMPTLLKQNSFLSKEDKDKIEKDIRKLSVNFLYGNETEIRVKLTDNGKRRFHNNLISRPAKDEAASTEEEFIFHCSESQAYIYFYPFGEHAEIISPLSLRNRILESHKKAMEIYA